MKTKNITSHKKPKKRNMAMEYSYLREIEVKFKNKKVAKKAMDTTVYCPESLVELFRDLQNETKEKLIAVNLDAKNKIICFEVVAIGSVSTIFARPIEVFRTAILVNASSIVLVHNHPSGEPRPSGDDIAFTKRIKRISDDLGLRFCDHIIIGFNNYYSFANEGLIFTEKINEDTTVVKT